MMLTCPYPSGAHARLLTYDRTRTILAYDCTRTTRKRTRMLRRSCLQLHPVLVLLQLRRSGHEG